MEPISSGEGSGEGSLLMFYMFLLQTFCFHERQAIVASKSISRNCDI